ncbi:hypothetical protein BSKO_03202 [Bryopsis sp. KO-2023]|nr:hypothetical protein BSKO_03202 [Bryopsis sp. KO-2023]
MSGSWWLSDGRDRDKSSNLYRDFLSSFFVRVWTLCFGGTSSVCAMVLRTCNICEACGDRNLLLALFSEFLGVALFQFFGGGLAIKNPSSPNWQDPGTVLVLALGNGIIYAVLVYLTRHISGGHLNPSVTVAVTLSGHMNFIRGVMYILFQLLGGVVGAFASHLSLAGGSYCFGIKPSEEDDIGAIWNLFSWEVVMTFVLIMVIYSSVIAPGHGDMGPFVIGLAVTGMMWAGVPHSAGAMNPARIVGPNLANLVDQTDEFNCSLKTMWYYIVAQGVAAVIAAFAALVVHGKGPHYAFTRRTRSEGDDALLEEEEGVTTI